MSVTRKSLALAAVVVAVLAVAGTAVGATRYVITSLSQISPTVVKQLHGATGSRGPAGPTGPAGNGDAYVADGTVAALNQTATTVVTLALPKAPAFVQATVTVSNNSGPTESQATCALNLDGTAIAPAITITVPAELTPVSSPGTTSTTFYAPVKTLGTLTLTCLDVANTGALGAQGSVAALTTGTATLVAAPSPSATASGSPSASPSPSASATPSASASPSGSASPSPSSSASPSSTSALPPPLH